MGKKNCVCVWGGGGGEEGGLVPMQYYTFTLWVGKQITAPFKTIQVKEVTAFNIHVRVCA